MPISKICSRCGKRIPTGTTCDCAKIYSRERNKVYNHTQRDEKESKFHSSYRWQQCRKRIIDKDGCDVYLYMKEGIMVPADTVHHIIPLKDDWSKRFSTDNLIALSASTHSTIERMYLKDKKKMIEELTEMVRQYRSGSAGVGGI